jgi:hypothetical protein
MLADATSTRQRRKLRNWAIGQAMTIQEAIALAFTMHESAVPVNSRYVIYKETRSLLALHRSSDADQSRALVTPTRGAVQSYRTEFPK